MLKILDGDNVSSVISFAKKHPLGVHISCKIKAYGTNREFLSVWYAEDEKGVNAAILYFYGDIVICADDNADFEEIKTFLDAYGYETVCGEKEILLKCGFSLCDEKKMFKYTNDVFETYDEVKKSDKIKEVYDLISYAIPGSFSKDNNAYLSFLSDFTFRERRSLARVKTVCENDSVLSCALTAAESDSAALISGVACREKARGKGYGKKTVLSLANELKNENKDVYVIALNDSAKDFYKKIGFTEILNVGYTERQ